jgi:hypothetical protein
MVDHISTSSCRLRRVQGCHLGDTWLRHAAHIEQPADTTTPKHNGLPLLGSVVVDASANQLRASFINVDGEVLDRFTIER